MWLLWLLWTMGGIIDIFLGLNSTITSGAISGFSLIMIISGIGWIVLGIKAKYVFTPPPRSDTKQKTVAPEKPKANSASSEPPVYPPISTPPSSPKQKVCKFCGHPYAPGDTFCTECGAVDVE